MIKSVFIKQGSSTILPAHWAVVGAAHQMLGQKSEGLILERVTGVEPVSSPWEGDVEPLNYTRVCD